MAETEEGMEDYIDDEEKIDDGAHEKLLNSIYALDGKKRRKNIVRGLPSTSSNVDLTVHASANKIQLKDLNLKSRHAETQLKKPLTDQETEKAQRQIARHNMVTEMSKWEPVVQDIRAAPQTVFSKRPYGIKMYQAVQPKPFTPRTPLEKEIYEALGKSEDILRPDQEMTVAETKAIKAMSVKEAKQRRAELLKHHELLSRVELKAKYQNKIKSKTYRKILRKDKVMAEKKLLEQLQKTDPEAFIDKLEQMEKARMEERLTLKHRGGGKFSRMHKAYSKFDDKTRDAVQDMLQKSREITRKRQHVSSSEDEGNSSDKNEMGGESANLKVDSDDEDAETDKIHIRARQQEILKAVNKKAGGWLDIPKTNQFDTRHESEVSVQAHLISSSAVGISSENNDVIDVDPETNTSRDGRIDNLIPADITVDINSDSLNQSKSGHTVTLKSIANNSSENIPESLKKLDPIPSERSNFEESEELDVNFTKQNIPQIQQNLTNEPKKKRKRNRKKKNVDSINESTSVERKEKPVKEISLQDISDTTDANNDSAAEDDEMKVTMEELFQDEDVVEEFAKEKAEAEERSRPKYEDTMLPGWGNWAGPDYKNSKQNERQKKKAINKSRHLQQQQQKIKQPNVWLNPNRDDAIRKLQPKTVPFPYTSVQQYEASLRQPVSRGFIRETAFKLLTKPEVVTKLGHIIKPMDKEDYFRNKEIDVSEEFEAKTNKSSKQGNKGPKQRKSIR